MVSGKQKAGRIFEQTRSAEEESIGIELTTSNFSSGIMKIDCDSTTALKFAEPEYQIEKLTSTITVKIFTEKSHGRNVMATGK